MRRSSRAVTPHEIAGTSCEGKWSRAWRPWRWVQSRRYALAEAVDMCKRHDLGEHREAARELL